MKIERSTVGTVDVLKPSAALIEDDATDFTKLLLARLKSPNPRVVVSLQDVPYMDSTALEGLLDGSDELAQRAAALKLAQVPPTCREILELTGLAGRFRFFEEVQDAVRSYL